MAADNAAKPQEFCDCGDCAAMRRAIVEENAAKSQESRLFEAGVPWVSVPTPPMPEGFTDRAAWDAIHWRFSEKGALLDAAVIGWQKDNQERVKAAMEAETNV